MSPAAPTPARHSPTGRAGDSGPARNGHDVPDVREAGRPKIIWFVCFAAAGTAFALFWLTTLVGIPRTPPIEVVGFIALWVIAAIWLDIQILREDDGPSDAGYIAKRPDGAVVALTAFPDSDGVGDLAAEVRQRVTTTQIPRVLAEVSDGRTVRFGRLAVNRHGLRDRRRQVVPWDQVVSVQTFWDEVVVRTHLRFRKRVRHPIGTVPNAPVLADVAETLIRTADHR